VANYYLLPLIRDKPIFFNLTVIFFYERLSPFSVTTHVVRLKLFRLKGSEEHDCRTLAETSDSCTKHGFKMRFFLTVFSLQPIFLSSYLFLFCCFIARAFLLFFSTNPQSHFLYSTSYLYLFLSSANLGDSISTCVSHSTRLL